MLGKARLGRPSPAMVVALVALFAALGGVAGAAFVSSPGNVMKACVARDGALKLVDETATSCPGSQTLVSLAGVNGSGKVANADTLDGQDSAAFLAANAKANDADKLDGQDSNAFQPAGAAAGGDLTGNYPNPTIGAGKVTSSNILDGTITAGDLAAASINAGALASGAVTTAKLDADAVTADKLAEGSVNSTSFAAGSKAPNSDMLDNLDSSDFARARHVIPPSMRNIARGEAPVVLLAAQGFDLYGDCPAGESEAIVELRATRNVHLNQFSTSSSNGFSAFSVLAGDTETLMSTEIGRADFDIYDVWGGTAIGSFSAYGLPDECVWTAGGLAS